jgi:hypothetical protein
VPAVPVADPDPDGHGPNWTMPATVSSWPTPPVDTTPAAVAHRRTIALVASLVVLGLVLGFGLTYIAAGDDAPARAFVAPPPSVSPSPTITLPPFTFPTVPSFTIPTIPIPVPPSTAPATTPGTTPATTPGGTTPGATTPGGTTPGGTTPAPVDPSAGVLAGLVVRQSDVPAADSVDLIADGDSLGEATLDLCNGTFPSEAKRTARLQVAQYDPTGSATLSTEAVLYNKGASSTQAFAELRAVAKHCPSTPVVSPVGEPTITTQFNAPPDGTWAHEPGVERLAYDETQTDDAGLTSHSIVVYLRRGRVLMGLYFLDATGPQEPVDGHTTIPAIENVFERRMAALPVSAVADP